MRRPTIHRRGVAAIEMMMTVTVIFCFGLLASSVWQIRKADITVRQDTHRDVFAETIRLVPDLPPIPGTVDAPPAEPPNLGELPDMDAIWDTLGSYEVVPEPDLSQDVKVLGITVLEVNINIFYQGDWPTVDFPDWGDIADPTEWPLDLTVNLPIYKLLPSGQAQALFLALMGGLTVEELFNNIGLGLSWPPSIPGLPNFNDLLGEIGNIPGLPNLPWNLIVPELFHEDPPYITVGPKHVKYWQPSLIDTALNFWDLAYYPVPSFDPFFGGGKPNKQWHLQSGLNGADGLDTIEFGKGNHTGSRHLSIHTYSFSLVKGKGRPLKVDPYVGTMGEWDAFWLQGSPTATIGPTWTWMMSPVVPTTPVFQFNTMRKWYANGLASALDQHYTNSSRSDRPTQNNSNGFRKKLKLTDMDDDYPRAWD